MDNRAQLEDLTTRILEMFDVYAPPVPIELMLQKPLPGLWEKIDITQLSGSFLSVKERFSPRMSLARLLARHIAASEWGQQQGLLGLLHDSDAIQAFARMLIMPREMIMGLTASSRNPAYISTYFEAPQEDASQRLIELIE